MDLETVEAIENKMGEFIALDAIEEEFAWGKILCIRVKLDMNKPLRRVMQLAFGLMELESNSPTEVGRVDAHELVVEEGKLGEDLMLANNRIIGPTLSLNVGHSRNSTQALDTLSVANSRQKRPNLHDISPMHTLADGSKGILKLN
ncbi:hypothetical protein ACH5RR_015171 [Cinchona calisaya]|uniref:Uncharacterized protein n=1 Tax=Cinchona calisaya TaxID=153742 RepID=A0ABD2ZV23_9GENT